MGRGLRSRIRGGGRKRGERGTASDQGADPGISDAQPGDGDVELDDDVELDGDADGDWLAYELHEWASESRTMLARLLVAESVVHSWQGTTLVVHDSAEHNVDMLVDEVKAAESLDLDPENPQMAFDMQGWSGELQAQLSELLGARSIPHTFDAEGDLVCHTEDEDLIDSLIDELLAQVADESLEELEGLEANDLLSALFEATDRLCRDLGDVSGRRGAVQHGRRLAATATPFGFSASSWAALRDRADELADLIESEASEEAEEADLVDLASRLRDGLRHVI